MKIFRTDPDLFGIRARLLTLLLPGILGLLALDSYNDYRGLHTVVQDAYDRGMLESASVVRSGISLAPDGSLRLAAPAVVKSMLDPTSPLHKHLHVALVPHARAATAATATTNATVHLLGEPDLPTAPPSPGASAPVDATAPIWYDSVYHGEPIRMLSLVTPVVDGRGQHFDLVIQTAESLVPRDQAQAASLRQELSRDARMLVVMLLLVWLGVTWSLWPLEQLRKSVLARSPHDLEPLDTSGVPHEVAPLVDAVNQHVASYRELLDEQSQFLAEASHQLRTPLAIMLTQAGVALRDKDPETSLSTLRAIVVQISRSRRLCEQLLSLAHASDSTPAVDAPRLTDLNAVAKDVVLQYLTLAHEKNQDLGWIDARESLAPGQILPETADGLLVPVLARSLELHEALSNLVHNAINYTPVGARITVTVRTQGELAMVEVQDDGPGIAPARREEVFERFRRVEQVAGAVDRGPRGAGLGLPIARAYARRNGGDIDLDGPLPGSDALGLRAILRLPLAGARTAPSAG